MELAKSFFIFFLIGNCLAEIRNVRQAETEFRFASYYANQMVLQRGPQRANIWGFADRSDIGANVTLTVTDSTNANITTDYAAVVRDGPTPSDAMWEVLLNAETSQNPFTITARLNQRTEQLTNVLFGDIWFCSGQSNMVHTVGRLDNPDDELDTVENFPDVRIFRVNTVTADNPLFDLPFNGIVQNWELPTYESIEQFSAICWLYGKEMHIQKGYPIGLITSAWGGTRIEEWMSPDAMNACNAEDLAAEYLWNAMIHPFLPMTLYGSLWYQGEGNAGQSAEYSCLFPAMISDWRTKWNARNAQTSAQFPFGFVQLAPNADNDVDIGFPDLRWAQTANVGYNPNPQMPGTFMAVAMDQPDFDSPYGTVHPRYKRPLADRLVLGGRNIAYNETFVVHQGPFPTTIVRGASGVGIDIQYDNANTRVDVRTVEGFEICCSEDEDEQCPVVGIAEWEGAPILEVRTTSITIQAQCADASDFIVGVRYAWRVSPCARNQCAIYSAQTSLPGPPFIHWAVL
ncbi:unnamed protein product [Owenia fusiformis]|uniref:Sialate O-acetylesterase domain-containing protein n=1 Tax=Owenia fusiformis TaxID=6347 RepID=A0A8J1UL96_OWEFU|nr:unnamed protein product [Owenia fusiformis]